MLSFRLWRKRLVFWLGAIIVGVAASGFAKVADQAQNLFTYMISVSIYLPLIVSPAIFAFVTWATVRYFSTSAGSGIPQAIAVRALRTPESQRYLLGPRVIAGKMILTALALVGGASIGREGPTVQVGAAIMLVCAGLGGLGLQRGIVLAGSAAGVAAAFNAPLAGIVFAIEEMARSFEHRNSGIVLTAIVISGVASMSILGNYAYFGHATEHFIFTRDWVPIIVIAVLGGAAGSVFARLMTDGNRGLRKLFKGYGGRHPVVFGGFCGIVVALLGLATHGGTYGTGYSVANDLLHERVIVSWGYAAAKFVATTLSNISGIPGGLFSPSLTVGAALGSSMSPWFAHTPLQLVVLLGMVAYFAGVTQAPITAFVIVLEITGEGVTAAPLIAAAVIATAVARIITPESLYHALAKDFIEQTKVELGPKKAAEEAPGAPPPDEETPETPETPVKPTP